MSTEDWKRKRVQWLMQHPLWTHPTEDGPRDGSFKECVDITVVFVNHASNEIEDPGYFGDQNDQFQVWLEAGPWFDLSQDSMFPAPLGGWTEWNRWAPSHDIDLDCGGDDLLQAMLNLADLVEQKFGQEGVL